MKKSSVSKIKVFLVIFAVSFLTRTLVYAENTAMPVSATTGSSVHSTELGNKVEDLGVLEVNITPCKFGLDRLKYGFVKVVTVGIAQTPDRGEIYRSQLSKKLLKTAKKKFGADEVIELEFWPDPSSDKFPNNKIFVRGRMLRDKPFPETEKE